MASDRGCNAELTEKTQARGNLFKPHRSAAVGRQESTRVHPGVDRLDADGTRVLAPESTNPATPRPPSKNTLFRGCGRKCRCHRDFRPDSESRRDSRRSTIIIMRT